MTRDQLLQHVLRGRLLIVGEFRGERARNGKNAPATRDFSSG